MREIKFRIWYPKSKKMVLWSEVIGLHISTIFQKDSEFQKLMQYTGLKDKNGAEIYEGDIVAYKTFFYGKERDHKKVVKWEKWVSDDFEQPDCVGYFNLSSEMEVIGNVYENPELLINKREEI